MQLKRLYIKEYKLFKDFTYEFPCDYQRYINVLIGINGSGKSTILEAIAEIFSCVVLGEKAKFGFELEYSVRLEELEEYSFGGEFKIDFLLIKIKADIDENPGIMVFRGENEVLNGMREINADKSLSQVKAQLPANFFKILPDNIVIYYSGVSEIIRKICEPHSKILSESLRKGDITSFQFFYYEPKLLNIILLCLLSFEYGDVPEFLLNKAKIAKVQSIQFNLKRPTWAKESIENFWGARGAVKDFLELIFTSSKNIHKTKSFSILDIKYTINQSDLFEIREHFVDEITLFKVVYSLFLDGFLEDIAFTFNRIENDTETSFSILSEGEQQSITIKGLTELLAGENTLFLFDEPDTFLHPKWQRNFISEIEETIEAHRPNELTYLIATHSPQILSNARPDKTFVKIIEDGQLVEQTPKHYGREISSILYNLMGVEERNETIRKELSKLFMLIEDEEIEEAETLLKDLTEVLGDTDADIQNAMIQLNYLKENEAD